MRISETTTGFTGHELGFGHGTSNRVPPHMVFTDGRLLASGLDYTVVGKKVVFVAQQNKAVIQMFWIS